MSGTSAAEQDPRGGRQQLAEAGRRVRPVAAVVCIAVAWVVDLWLQVGAFVAEHGWTLSSFRDYYPPDQLSYLAIVTNGAQGHHAVVEPFTMTGTSHYPDLYYRVLGLIADVTGANPVQVWNIMGVVMQSLLIIVLAVTCVVLTRRSWTALLAPLPLMIGTLSQVVDGVWRTELLSHAVLWGPFAVLFTANGESAALCLSGAAMLGLLIVTAGRVRGKRAVALASVCCGVIGMLSAVQTYSFLVSVFVLAFVVAVYGIMRARSWIWAGVSAALLVVVLVGGQFVASFSPLAALVFAVVPAVPGVVLVARELRWWPVVFPAAALVVCALPQLLRTLLGIVGGDPFLVYREASSANLGIPWATGLRCGAVMLVILAFLAYGSLYRRRALPMAVVIGSGLAWAIGATNDRWGANQEPYRFWIDTLFVVAIVTFPLVLRAAFDLAGSRKKAPGRQRWQQVLGVTLGLVAVGVYAVGALDFVEFRRDIASRAPKNYYSDDTRALADVASASTGGLVMPDPCIDPFTLKLVWGGPTAYYNLGLAWPTNRDPLDAALSARQNQQELDAPDAYAGGVRWILTDSTCPSDWAGTAESDGWDKVASQPNDHGGTYDLWRLEP